MSSRVKIVLKALVTVGLLGFLVYRMDLEVFWAVVSSASWSLVLLAGLLHLVTVVPSVTRWKTVLRNFDIHTPYLQLARICLIGYFFNMFLPSAIGGDFFRAYYLKKREEQSMTTTLTSTVVDRLSGLTAMLIIGLTFCAIFPVSIEGYSLLPVFLLLVAVFGLGITVVFHPRIHRTADRLLERFEVQSLREKLDLVYAGLRRVRGSGSTILLVVALSLLIQFLVVVAMWVAARSIGVLAPFHLFLIFIPIVNLSVAVPLTINGVGLRESVYFLLFSQVGVAVEPAVTLSLLNLLVVAMTALPGGIVYSLYKKEEEFPVEQWSR